MKRQETIENPTARDAAFRMLLRVENEGAYADRILSSPNVPGMEERDRLFVRELLLGVLRWKLRLDRIIDRYYNKPPDSLAPEVRNILRLGLFQIMFMDSVPDWAAVNESVDMAVRHREKRVTGLVNAVLRRFCREGEPSFPSDPAERMSVEFSHPLWLIDRWIRHYDDDAAEEMCRAGNEKHPVFIRISGSKTTEKKLVSLLGEGGFEAVVVPEMPGYLTIRKGKGLFESAAFQRGHCTVQDPAAGMAVELLAPQPGESIVDLCAAPGGKTTHCAELMDDSGQVAAVDIHPGRLGLVRENARRLSLSSIICTEGDARSFGRKENLLYDRVLIDAPCTGTGVFAKRPDSKWRVSEQDVARLALLQGELLDNAARMVKPGGVLVYSTCSLEPEENEYIVHEFLDRHKEFSIERDEKFEKFYLDGGYIILPHQMHGTGAFAAKLRRG